MNEYRIRYTHNGEPLEVLLQAASKLAAKAAFARENAAAITGGSIVIVSVEDA